MLNMFNFYLVLNISMYLDYTSVSQMEAVCPQGDMWQ